MYVAPLSPGITAVSPVKDSVGTLVTITGNNFNPDTALNYVYFGPARAQVISASSNSLVVKVPFGATYGPVSVTTNSLTSYSQVSFIPIFSGGGNISSGSFNEFVTNETAA